MNEMYNVETKTENAGDLLEKAMATAREVVGKSYQEIKDRILFRVMETERNAPEILQKNYMHKEVLNVSIIPAISVGGDGEKTAALLMTEEIGRAIGAPSASEMLDDLALADGDRASAWIIMTYAELMALITGIEVEGTESLFFTVTRKDHMYGAYPIFHEKSAEYIFRKVGPYYALPSSIHEVLIRPMSNGKADAEALAFLCEMVKDVNCRVAAPEEVLCNGVYYYENPDEGLQFYS